MSGSPERKDDGGYAFIETRMAEKINELTLDLISTLPTLKPKRLGDRLLDFLLYLIRVARKLGSRVIGWFSKVNKEWFCNVILMWATIAQKQLLDKVRFGGPSKPFQQHTIYDFHKGVDVRNLSLVYHLIDYVGTFDAWELGDMEQKLDDILSSSNQSQRILRYMTTASPHIHGGSWIVLTQARSYLRTYRTFGDFQQSMNSTPGKMDEVVRKHAEKALLDIYQTENAARYRVLLNSSDRKRVVAEILNNNHAPHYPNTLYSVNLQQLPRQRRQTVVRLCQRFWAQDEISKLIRWMNEGIRPVDLARGMFHFSSLCMYPSSRMIDRFLGAAFRTTFGLDGDAIIGHLDHAIGPSQLRTPVKVFEFFSQDGISSPNLHILGPMLSDENTNVVQKKFDDLSKYGYKHNVWKHYKSFLRYGFELNVDQLHIKKHLKKMVITFLTQALPREVQDRSVFLYSHLKRCHHLSELPLTIIFQFDGIFHWYEHARARMEHKRIKSVLQQQQYEERKGKKRELRTALASPVVTAQGSPLKKQRRNPTLNIQMENSVGNCVELSSLEISEQIGSSFELIIAPEEKDDVPISSQQQFSFQNEVTELLEED